MRLDDEHNGIVTMRNQREDRARIRLSGISFLPSLARGSHQNAGYPIYRLQEFQTDSRQLLNSALQRGLQDLHAGGLTKYEHCPT